MPDGPERVPRALREFHDRHHQLRRVRHEVSLAADLRRRYVRCGVHSGAPAHVRGGLRRHVTRRNELWDVCANVCAEPSVPVERVRVRDGLQLVRRCLRESADEQCALRRVRTSVCDTRHVQFRLVRVLARLH